MVSVFNRDIKGVNFGFLSAKQIIEMSSCQIHVPGMVGPGTVYDRNMGCVVASSEECPSCKQGKGCWGHFGYIRLSEPFFHPATMKMVANFLKCICKWCSSFLIESKDMLSLYNLKKSTGKNYFMKILKICEKIPVCVSSTCRRLQPKIMYKVKNMEISMENKKKSEKYSIVLTPQNIFEIFDKISDDDIKLMGFNPKRVHPRNFILTVLPVLPTCSRPSVYSEGKICDDDLTCQYQEIVKLNNLLEDESLSTEKKNKVRKTLAFKISTIMNNTSGKAKHPTDQRAICCLRTRIAGKAGRIRNNIMGKRVDHSGRTVITADPTLKLGVLGIPYDVSKIHTVPVVVTDANIDEIQKLVDNEQANFVLRKKGDSQTKLALKYAQHKRGTELESGDIIIRGDVKIDPENVIIPVPTTGYVTEKITKNKTIETSEKTFVWRDGEIKEYGKGKSCKVQKGDIIVTGDYIPVYDSDGTVVKPSTTGKISVIHVRSQNDELSEGDILIRDRKLQKVEYPKFREIKLQEGDIVERHLQNGDFVMFNRQPTLWMCSMMSMQVKIDETKQRKTYHFNTETCSPFNADFDGDEMNTHIPQTEEAQVEIAELSHAKKLLISGQESKPSIRIIQDSLLAAYLMTSTIFELTESQFFRVLNNASSCDGKNLFSEEKKGEILSIWEKHEKEYPFHTSQGILSFLFPPDFHYNAEGLVIDSGVYVEGVLTKKFLGSSYESLILYLNKEYGYKFTSNFIDNIQFVTREWLLIRGFSIGFSDCMISEENLMEIRSTVIGHYVNADTIAKVTQNENVKETRITAELSNANNIGMKIAKSFMKPSNNFLIPPLSGAKGDFFNIAQITGLLGQQNLKGKRVEPYLNNGRRTLPHYPFIIKSAKDRYESRGFISNGFIKGLNPFQSYFHNVAGRQGILDTSLSTAGTGYLQRRIIKACEDIATQYDGTVRGIGGEIYQFVYGNNGFDPTKTVHLDGEPQICDIGRMAEMLNTRYEKGILENEKDDESEKESDEDSDEENDRKKDDSEDEKEEKTLFNSERTISKDYDNSDSDDDDVNSVALSDISDSKSDCSQDDENSDNNSDKDSEKEILEEIFDELSDGSDMGDDDNIDDMGDIGDEIDCD